MTPELDKHIDAILANSAVAERINYLAERWADEKEFEDFADYEKALKALLAEEFPAATYVGATKRPFGIKYTWPEARGTFRIFRKLNGNKFSMVWDVA